MKSGDLEVNTLITKFVLLFHSYNLYLQMINMHIDKYLSLRINKKKCNIYHTTYYFYNAV